jgi:hypothetical protein
LRLVFFAMIAALASLRCAASPDSVVTFNEVHYHPKDSVAESEWLELHNQMAVRIDLSGWQITGGVLGCASLLIRRQR